MQFSSGSLGVFGEFEYILFNSTVYRAHINDVIDVTNGVRSGARFECTESAWVNHPLRKSIISA